jgi:DNA-binding MarR family transcriptional regulator
MNDKNMQRTVISFLLMEEMAVTYLWPIKMARYKNMNQSQMGALREIRAKGRLNLSQLANQVSVTNQSMTGISNVLVEKDLVERVYDDANRRQIELQLTPKGMEFIDTYDKENLELISQVFSKLSEEDCETLQRASDEIYAILDKTAFGEKFAYKKDYEKTVRQKEGMSE